MAVPCPGCGREYDVSLFSFGRTLWCACGSRVGDEPRVRNLAPGGAPRFLADAMLGRLARWLRFLGFDCAYEADIDDAELVRRGVEEQRIILTRDRALPEAWRVAGIHLLEAETPFEQLAEVVRAFSLAGRVRLFRRCGECNTQLRPLAAADARERVPARVRERHDRFRECPGCGRVYWEGTHAQRMRRVADRVLEDAARP